MSVKAVIGKFVTEADSSVQREASKWFIYMIRASDESLYTGITTDVKRRFIEHGSPKKGARYFRGRQPLEIVYTEPCADRSFASRREAEIKKMSRNEKLSLIGQWNLPDE